MFLLLFHFPPTLLLFVSIKINGGWQRKKENGSSLLTKILAEITNQAIVEHKELEREINQPHRVWREFPSSFSSISKFMFRGSFLKRQLKTLKLRPTFSFPSLCFCISLLDLCYFQLFFPISFWLLIIFISV